MFQLDDAAGAKRMMQGIVRKYGNYAEAHAALAAVNWSQVGGSVQGLPARNCGAGCCPAVPSAGYAAHTYTAKTLCTLVLPLMCACVCLPAGRWGAGRGAAAAGGGARAAVG
jgi:hypothetical protein